MIELSSVRKVLSVHDGVLPCGRCWKMLESYLKWHYLLTTLAFSFLCVQGRQKFSVLDPSTSAQNTKSKKVLCFIVIVFNDDATKNKKFFFQKWSSELC